MTSEQTTRYTEDKMKRISETRVPNSNIVATTIVVDGFTLSQIDQLGGSHSYSRDYTATGITTRVTDPRGNTSTSISDKSERPIQQIDAAGNATRIAYCNCCDQPASITDAMGNTAHYVYDIRGRKVAEYGTGIQPIPPPPLRGLWSQIAPPQFAYIDDSANRIIAHTTFRVEASDIISDPSERRDGDSTRYSYHDATGLLCAIIYPDGRSTRYSYTRMGQLETLINARGTSANHSYDSLTGNLLEMSYSDESPSTSYSYNQHGALRGITDSTGTQKLSYNPYGQVETIAQRINGQQFSVEERYDELGRWAGYQLQQDERNLQNIATGYDSQGRISSSSFEHAGQTKQFRYSYLDGTAMYRHLSHPNGIESAYAYEPQRNLITSITDSLISTSPAAQEQSRKAYSYDALGRLVTRQLGERSASFAYNSRSELITAAQGPDNYGYSYDNIGNRKSAQELAEEISYAANANNQYTDITAMNGKSFVAEFDADGNQTKLQTNSGIWRVTYNAQNRPVRFTIEDGGIIIDSAYDYMGRRAWKKVSTKGAVTKHERYLYRGPCALPSEVSSGASVSTCFAASCLQIAAIDLNCDSEINDQHYILWDPTEPRATRPLALQKEGSWYSYGLDLSKNVKELYSRTGAIATTYDYSPFVSVTETGSTSSPLQWSSEVCDSELALVYYNYRHYNPADSRWINRDPIGTQGGLNLYEFVGNQVWVVDYLGLKKKCKEGEMKDYDMVYVERETIQQNPWRKNPDERKKSTDRYINAIDYIDNFGGIYRGNGSKIVKKSLEIMMIWEKS